VLTTGRLGLGVEKSLPVQSGEEKMISSLSRKKKLIIKIGCRTN
jgi:hypothetical protein